MLKGKMEIELRNVKTGEVQHITEDNMFTKALYYYLNENYGGFIFNDISTVNNVNVNDMFPLVERGLGGLMLLPETEVENEENLYPHSFPTAVAVKDREDYGTNRLMGLYNTAQSGAIENGFRFVYEFMTTQGNGTIACACLTNKGPWNTNTTDALSKIDYNITNNLGEFRNYKYAITQGATTYQVDRIHFVGNVNGKLYAIQGVNENNKFDLEHPKIRLLDTNIVLTGCNKITDIGVNSFNNSSSTVVANSTNLREIEIPHDYSEFSSIAYSTDPLIVKAFPHTNNTAIVFVSIYRSVGIGSSNYMVGADGWTDCYIVDLLTYEIEFLRTIEYPTLDPESGDIIIPETPERRLRELTYNDRTAYNLCWDFDICPNRTSGIYSGYGWFDYPNLIYTPSYYVDGLVVTDNYYVIKVNVVSGEIVAYDMGNRKNKNNNYSMCQLYPDRDIIGFDQRILNLNTGRYKDISPMRINTTNGNFYYPIFNKLMGLSVYNYWDYKNRYKFGRNLTYMATINNLSSPITKTSEQTMKITYTIMDAEE